jgi:Holliday junction resolvase RusA-like endonuclease
MTVCREENIVMNYIIKEREREKNRLIIEIKQLKAL